MKKIAFGQRLRELRKSKGVTQKALALSVGLNNQHLSRIEANYFVFTLGRAAIIKIAAALKLTQAESDELHVLAGRIPADVERALLADAGWFTKIRGKI